MNRPIEEGDDAFRLGCPIRELSNPNGQKWQAEISFPYIQWSVSVYISAARAWKRLKSISIDIGCHYSSCKIAICLILCIWNNYSLYFSAETYRPVSEPSQSWLETQRWHWSSTIPFFPGNIYFLEHVITLEKIRVAKKTKDDTKPSTIRQIQLN